MKISEPLVVETKEDAGLFLAGLPTGQVFGVDTETIGVNPKKETPASGVGQLFCWSIAYKNTTGEITRAYLSRDTLSVFKDWLESPNVKKVGHNIFSFDQHIFANMGITLRGVVGDTLRMSKLAYNHPDARHGLKPLSKLHLGIDMKEYGDLFSRPKRLKDKVVKKDSHSVKKMTVVGYGVVKVPTFTGSGILGRFSLKQKELIPLDQLPKRLMPTLYDYASLDAAATLLLFDKFKSKLSRLECGSGTLLDFYRDKWNPCLQVLTAAERNGFYLEEDTCHQALRDIQEACEELSEEITKVAGDLNVNSWQQMGEFLYDICDYPIPPIAGSLKAVKRVKKGERPTSEAALDWLARNIDGAEIIHKIIRYKKLLKERTRIKWQTEITSNN